MKTILVAVIVIFIAFQIAAQNISTGSIANSHQNNYYVDLTGKAAKLNGGWGLLGGMGAGYNINRNFSLGLVAYGLIPNELGGSYINKSGRDTLHLGYGGLEASYKYTLDNNFYLAGTMIIGAGRVDYENMGGNDYFFTVEPGASVNYNIIGWFGLGYSVSYRFSTGVNYAEFSDASFSGWAMGLDFKFGF
jgi:hypothetical protein